jgi:hypothetical protein
VIGQRCQKGKEIQHKNDNGRGSCEPLPDDLSRELENLVSQLLAVLVGVLDLTLNRDLVGRDLAPILRDVDQPTKEAGHVYLAGFRWMRQDREKVFDVRYGSVLQDDDQVQRLDGPGMDLVPLAGQDPQQTVDCTRGVLRPAQQNDQGHRFVDVFDGLADHHGPLADGVLVLRDHAMELPLEIDGPGIVRGEHPVLVANVLDQPGLLDELAILLRPFDQQCDINIRIRHFTPPYAFFKQKLLYNKSMKKASYSVTMIGAFSVMMMVCSKCAVSDLSFMT